MRNKDMASLERMCGAACQDAHEKGLMNLLSVASTFSSANISINC